MNVEGIRKKVVAVEKERTLQGVKTALDGVRKILAEDERARNNDLWLLIRFWRDIQGLKIFIPYEAVENNFMITPETITRARRHIQNKEGRFIPTDPKVREKRGIKQVVMREFYGRGVYE
ncbi:hypothetical protein D6827_03580 [Candidatus Parcubacteria bacterium]|nr:MAG: hypothetical protein D6827_03580 [Candidatus Parcubacteria bacterium]